MSDYIKREDAIKAIFSKPACHGSDGSWYHSDDIRDAINSTPSVDRPQGHWTKTDVATYRCSECGKKQIADDINELNFCCCCGSRNKVRRLKGADDE